MKVKVYKSREDWKKGYGQLCDGVFEIGDSHCVTVEDSYGGIEVFIGKNGRVYTRGNLPLDKKEIFIACAETLINYYLKNLDKYGNRIYLSRSSGNFAINGKIIPDTENEVLKAAINIFYLLVAMDIMEKHGVTVVSLPTDLRVLPECYVYFRQTDNTRYADLFTKADFKNF